MARFGRAQPFAPKLGRLAPQGAAITASATLTEAADGAAGSAAVLVTVTAAFTEAADDGAGAAAIGITASAALAEAADLLAGNAGAAAPTMVDPNYLISARPRARIFRAQSRVRNLLAAKRV